MCVLCSHLAFNVKVSVNKLRGIAPLLPPPAHLLRLSSRCRSPLASSDKPLCALTEDARLVSGLPNKVGCPLAEPMPSTLCSSARLARAFECQEAPVAAVALGARAPLSMRASLTWIAFPHIVTNTAIKALQLVFGFHILVRDASLRIHLGWHVVKLLSGRRIRERLGLAAAGASPKSCHAVTLGVPAANGRASFEEMVVRLLDDRQCAGADDGHEESGDLCNLYTGSVG